MCQDGSWVLYQRDGTETLVVVPWDVVPPFGGISARHVTLAFDQAARPAIAWEEADGIRLREFNEIAGNYAFIGPFEGCDPVLLNDATVNYHVAGSDVVLFYLSADRTKLMYRVQNENYLVEHEHLEYGTEVVLDAPDIGGYRFQLRHSDAAGEIIPETGSFLATLSDVYPIYVSEFFGAGVHSLKEGEYELVVMKRPAVAEGLTAVVDSLGDGLLQHVIILRSGADALTGVVGGLEDGVFLNVIIQRDPVTEAVEGAVAGLEDGAYVLSVIQRTTQTDGMTGVIGGLRDGAYVAA